MKCPYRKVVVHKPQKTIGYSINYARDIEEFADCHEKDCPYFDFYNRECKKVKTEDM